MNSEVSQFANDNILFTQLRSSYHFRDSQRNLTYTDLSLMNTKKNHHWKMESNTYQTERNWATHTAYTALTYVRKEISCNCDHVTKTALAIKQANAI